MGKQTSRRADPEFCGPSILQRAVKALLRPIVRFCLKHSIAAPEIWEMVKSELVQTAKGVIAEGGGEVNASRIAVMTGLQRRQVKALLEGTESTLKDANLLSRVIGLWLSHPNYIQENGSPRPLKIAGEDSEFFELVHSVTSDISPYTVLFGLEQAKSILREGEVVSLKKTSYVPRKDLESGLSMLAEDSADLIAAVEENIFGEMAVPNLHLTTSYDNVALESIPGLRTWLLKQGAEFHERLREYLSKHDCDSNPMLYRKESRARVTVSSFSRIQLPGD